MLVQARFTVTNINNFYTLFKENHKIVVAEVPSQPKWFVICFSMLSSSLLFSVVPRTRLSSCVSYGKVDNKLQIVFDFDFTNSENTVHIRGSLDKPITWSELYPVFVIDCFFVAHF